MNQSDTGSPSILPDVSLWEEIFCKGGGGGIFPCSSLISPPVRELVYVVCTYTHTHHKLHICLRGTVLLLFLGKGLEESEEESPAKRPCLVTGMYMQNVFPLLVCKSSLIYLILILLLARVTLRCPGEVKEIIR